MHREIRDHIEKVLTGSESAAAGKHLADCRDCRDDVRIMTEHAAMMRELRAPAGAEPRPGFYARVRERIEAEGAASIWNLFIESPFGRRIAYASLALALLLGVYMFSAERNFEPTPDSSAIAARQANVPVVSGPLTGASAGALTIEGEDAPGQVLSQIDQPTSSQDDVLVNLVTYREQ